MRCLHRLLIPMIASMAVLILLAGCGQNAAGSPGSPGTPGTIQRVKTAIVLTAVPTRLPSTPSAPQSTHGTVTLHVATIPQSARGALTLTLTNQSAQEISFADHLSECTVILLQMAPQLPDTLQWQTVAPCRAEIVTRMHTLAAGKGLTVTLLPPYGQWVPGLYRAVLSYNPSGANVPLETIFSLSFRGGIT